MGDSADAVGLNQAMVAEVETMLANGALEGLVRRLRGSFPSLPMEADAAVGHGVEKLITMVRPPDRPGPYLAACAHNEMKRLTRRRARELSLEALADRGGDEEEDSRPSWQPEQAGWTVEEAALLTATYEQLRAHVATWDTDNVRVVTLLYLEAAFLGEPLPSRDAADVAGDILGYNVGDAFVRTWKSRGFKRLREYANSADIVARDGGTDDD